jgi:hypothetical protein
MNITENKLTIRYLRPDGDTSAPSFSPRPHKWNGNTTHITECVVEGYGRKRFYRMIWRPKKKEYQCLMRAQWYNPINSPYDRIPGHWQEAVNAYESCPQSQETFEATIKGDFVLHFWTLDKQQQRYLFWLLEPQRMAALGLTKQGRKKQVIAPWASEALFPRRATKK